MRKIIVRALNIICVNAGFLAFRLLNYPYNYSMIIGAGKRGTVMVIPAASLIQARAFSVQDADVPLTEEQRKENRKHFH